MKKLLLLLPLIGAFALAGCGDEKEEESSGGDHLEYTAEQAKAKVKELGEGDGYEISYEVKSSGNESTHYTLGAKDHFYWANVDEARYLYYINGDVYQGYYYDSDTSEFLKVGEEQKISDMSEYEQQALDSARTGYGVYLYFGNTYAEGEGLVKKGTVTFAGRSATKYEYKWVAIQGSASYELIVDNETGITLKWAVSGQDNVSGESGSASVEVTSFKTGSAVEIPAHEPLKK